MGGLRKEGCKMGGLRKEGCKMGGLRKEGCTKGGGGVTSGGEKAAAREKFKGAVQQYMH